MATRTDRKTEPKRAAIYARVSDKSQDTEDKTSISEQISDMEAHCERRGLTITARYQEVGRGCSKNRPEFQRMLAAARRGRFDTIVCWKSDRLSRGMYPAAALMEVVEAYQIELEAVMDAIDMKTFGLMAAIGKIELDNFRERASMGKRGSAKQGRIPVNNVPYGYRLGEDRRPQVVEAEVEVIRRVFRMYVREGLGAPAIAKQLTAEGVPTPKAVGRWYDGTVTRILSHEAYRGTWWFGKVRHVSTEHGMRRYDRPEDEWVGVPFPPVVDDETWEQAQEAKKRRLTRSGRNTKLFYLLQHLVRCAECGFLMGCRAIRLYVSGKITENQLDHQRRFITERLETLRTNLDDHRARESAQAEKRAQAEHVVEWARRVGDRLDGLSDEGRREVLQLLLDGATIDRHNNVNLTLAIPTEDVVSIAELNATTRSTLCARRRAAPGASVRQDR